MTIQHTIRLMPEIFCIPEIIILAYMVLNQCTYNYKHIIKYLTKLLEYITVSDNARIPKQYKVIQTVLPYSFCGAKFCKFHRKFPLHKQCKQFVT